MVATAFSLADLDPSNTRFFCADTSPTPIQLIGRFRCFYTSASSECFYVDAGHTVHTTHHAG